EELTNDFGLQLLLEAHHQAGVKPPLARDAKVFDELYREMLPRSLSLSPDDPVAKRIIESGEHEGRKLLDSLPSGGRLGFSLERNYRAFCGAAQHYIYYVVSVNISRTADGDGSSAILAIAGRLPWLFTALRPGMLWESTAFSFAMYA